MASIESRGKGKWLLVVSGGSDESGKRIKHRRIWSGKTAKLAQKAADKWEEDIKQGRYMPASKQYTLRSFVDLWKSDYAETEIAPNTLHRYEIALDQRILPKLGKHKLEQITPVIINRFIKDLRSEPRKDKKEGNLSDLTVQHHFRILSSILGKAVEWDILASNPCVKATTPKARSAKVKVFDEKETKAFIEAVARTTLKHRILVWLEIATGVRESEMMGFEWKDINWQENTIKVCRSCQYNPKKGQYTRDKLKSESAVRTIALPQNVIELLKQYKAAQAARQLKLGESWKKSDRLFTTWDGSDGYYQWPGQWLDRFLKKNKLPHCSFHSLRHLHATVLINSNINLKSVSKRMGHSKISTTADIYAEALESVDRESAAIIGSMLGENKGPVGGQLVDKSSCRKFKIKRVLNR